ncbi:DUF1214 domain-containing protein [Streptomyces platensis]|uniref:DUF1214 domain-containing protein n=1 Tax=Streptomyces platensis TaxID=58346 RepID=UPI002E27490F
MPRCWTAGGAIGDRDALEFRSDGSLTLLTQHASPGARRESNWLPAPEGSFNVMLRMFWPRPEVLERTWHAPALCRIG